MNIQKGATNQSLYFYIVGDAGHATPGEPITGLLFSDIETGGSASYVRSGAARVDLTLVTLASASAAHTDGGFILVDDTNMPGLYRCDYPDAAFATGVDQVYCQLVVASANNAIVTPIQVDLNEPLAVGSDNKVLLSSDAHTGAVIPTVTTLTGHIPQTGDTYALANGASGFVAIDSVVGTINTNVGTNGAGLTNLGGSGNDWNTVVPDAQGVAPTAAENATQVWEELTATARTAGTYGQLIKDNIDATISSRMATSHLNATAGKLDGVALVDTTTENTDMRGTDSAALASVCTETRLSELDAATGGKMANQVDVIQTDTTTDIPASISALNDLSAAAVNAEVVDALATDTYAEPGQGAPAATASLAAKINYLFKAWRNRSTQTSTIYSLYNDAGTTVDQKATVSDNGTIADKGEVETGP